MTLAEMEQLARDGLAAAQQHVGHWQEVLSFVGHLQANPLVGVMEATVGGPLSADAMAILNGIASLTAHARPVPADGSNPGPDPAPVAPAADPAPVAPAAEVAEHMGSL
jgi:hypothetical protein